MAMAIQITSCLTQARDRRRYGILTTTFSAPVCTAPLFLLAGPSWAWRTLMATASRITCFTMEARDRRRYGISIITSEALACLVPVFLPAEASWRNLVALGTVKRLKLCAIRLHPAPAVAASL